MGQANVSFDREAFEEDYEVDAMCISLIGTIIMVIGILLGYFVLDGVENGVNIACNIAITGWGISMVAYLFGGLLTAIKLAGTIAKWGWYIIPFFPIDLIIAILAFFCGLFVLLYLPIIPIIKAYRESL